MKKAIILASSRGIGKAIADSLKTMDLEVITTSSKELETSNIEQIESFTNKHPQTDILVLNTGGPPAKNFYEITKEDWLHYYNQLFLSFCILLQKIKIHQGGYIFLISSYNIKEPDPNLILSNSYRIAFSSILKSLTQQYAAQEVSCVNIVPQGQLKLIGCTV